MNIVNNIVESKRMNRYSYCLNNPLKYVDPTGQTIVIAGNQADISLQQLQSFTNLTLTKNDNGMISIIGDIPSKLNSRDQWLMSIINDKKITVNITATDADIQNRYGGAFWGNKVNFDADGNAISVSTDQRVNPLKNYILDSFGERGQTIFHEITESFLGGKYSMIFGKSALPAVQGNSTYNTIADPAHRDAYPQPTEDKAKIEQRMKAIDAIKNFINKNW